MYEADIKAKKVIQKFANKINFTGHILSSQDISLTYRTHDHFKSSYARD